MTFETQKHLETAVHWIQKDHTFRVERAKEPSTYIWENLALTERDQKLRKLAVFAILGLILYLVYQFEYEMHYANRNFDTFEEINCEQYRSKVTGAMDETGA